MKSKITSTVLLFSVIFLSSCSGKFGIESDPQSNKTIEINQIKYRTGNAQIAELGSIGYVSGKGRLKGKNVFIKRTMPSYEDLEISNDGIIAQEITDNISKEYKFEIESEIEQLVEASANTNGTKATNKEKQVSYHLLSIKNPDEIVMQLNDPSNKRSLQLMEMNGKNSRLITQVIVAYDYKTSVIIDSSKNAGLKLKTIGSNDKLMIDDISIAKAKLETELGKTIKVNNSVSLSDGIIIGYAYDLVCWGKDTSGEKVILTSVVDRYGKKVECPAGVENPKKVK